MRITFVLPYAGLSGGTRVLAIYAQRLRRRGHHLTVVSTPPFQLPFHRKLKAFLRGKGWPRTEHEPSHFDGLDVPHHVIDRWRDVTDADVPDADVVVATWWLTAHGVAKLSPQKGAKALFIQGYEVVPGQSNPQLDATWRMPFHKITISQWLVELAKDRFADPVVSHVPNGVDTQQFHAPPRGKQPCPTVGMLYAPGGFKDCPTSFAAIELARRQRPELRLIAFGAYRPEPSLPLPPNTEFYYRPSQDSIKDLYARCDVWLCGSAREGFHLPPLEAMACRCPVVSTAVGGPLDIIREGENGHLVPIADSASLADRLLRVLALPQPQWLAMSDAAYQTALRFNWDDATTAFEAALQLAIERNARGQLKPLLPQP